MPITDEEKSKCRKIIHGHAAAAAAGNLVPVPMVGLATDTVTMTTMAMALASVFGGSITESVAKNMAINAIVATMKKQPVRIIAKEISKVFQNRRQPCPKNRRPRSRCSRENFF